MAGAGADDATRQGGNCLPWAQPSGVRVPVAQHDVAVQLAQHIHPLAVGVEIEVARTGFFWQDEVGFAGHIADQLAINARHAIDPDT